MKDHMQIFLKMVCFALPTPCISESCIQIKLIFTFTFLCGVSIGLHKTFEGTTKKCENKILSYFFSRHLELRLKGLTTRVN